MFRMIGEELRALAAHPQRMLVASTFAMMLVLMTTMLACFFGFAAARGLQPAAPPVRNNWAPPPARVPGTPTRGEATANPKRPRPEPAGSGSGQSSSAEEAYLRSVEAFNIGDDVVHYSIYDDTIDCFYNWTNYRVDMLQRMRDPQLQDGGYRLEILSTEPKQNTEELYDFIERGVLHGPSDYRVEYTKRVVLKRSAGRWKVVTEVDDNAHDCFPSAF